MRSMLILILLFSHQIQAETVRELTLKVIALEEKLQLNDRYQQDYYQGLPASSARVIRCDDLLGKFLAPRFFHIGDEHTQSYPVDLLEKWCASIYAMAPNRHWSLSSYFKGSNF